MGIGSGIFVFLRPPYHGGKDRPGRPGSKEKEIEFERERYPSFQKRDAQALRFGSMNSISKVFGGRERIMGIRNGMFVLCPPSERTSGGFSNCRTYGVGM